ncbi:hypothetical protein B0H10DRAFT_2443322 [Mycena sp. CBHHK59/15]|nr:hypothetical protein B0H10DRAFT_2443322 [Mycena sp. CBHHK59/15]
MDANSDWNMNSSAAAVPPEKLNPGPMETSGNPGQYSNERIANNAGNVTVPMQTDIGTASPNGNIPRRGDANYSSPSVKRLAISGPGRTAHDNALELVDFYKTKWLEEKRKMDAQREEERTKMNAMLEQVSHYQASLESQFREAIGRLPAPIDQDDHEAQLVDQILSYEQQIETITAEKNNIAAQAEAMRAAFEEHARRHDKELTEKSNEVLAMRAKLQPSSSIRESADTEFSHTPRFTNWGPRASIHRVIQNTSTRLPSIPLSPAPLPTTNFATADSGSANSEASRTNTDQSRDTVEQLVTDFLKKLGVDAVTFVKTKKKTLTKKQSGIKAQQAILSPDVDHYIKHVLRHTMRDIYNVQTADDFVAYKPIPAEEVALCNDGSCGPTVEDYRLDFSEGYRNSRWNEIIVDKIVDTALATLEKAGSNLGHPPVTRDYLVGEIYGQLTRAHDAWALYKPCFVKAVGRMETQLEADARAHGYAEKRGAQVIDRAQKKRKFDKRGKTVTQAIEIKSLSGDLDLPAWKQFSEILRYLGVHRMSSEEGSQKVIEGVTVRVYMVKICVWRAADIADYLRIIDQATNSMRSNRGPTPAPRIASEFAGKADAPTGLPECMYNLEWLAIQK